MSDDERAALEAGQRPVRRVREWRRLQAVRLLADGQEASAAAQAVGCSASAVYYWAEAWREEGLAGLAEGAHAGRPRRLDLQAETALAQLLVDDPQAHGYAATHWTAPLLRTELAQRGPALSEPTPRRT